jgi:hypothetical protein
LSIKKSEWDEWRFNDITKAFYHACQDRVEDTTDLLVAGAGLDPATDNFYRGFIAAYKEMEGFRVEDVEND